MSRIVPLLLLLTACDCGKPAGNQEKATTATTPPGEVERIAVPGARGSGSTEGATSGAPPPVRTFNPLRPEEGTLTVEKGEAKAGAPAAAAIKLAPGTGFHIATDYPIKLSLEAPAGVTLQKTELSAGGRNKLQGDAQTLSEQALAFSVSATAEHAGAYEIKGVLKFGICLRDSCRPKMHPITIQVAAN